MNEIVLKGVSISKGIAIGSPFFLTEKKDNPPHLELALGEIEKEIERYHLALKKSKVDLEHLQSRFVNDGATVVVEILGAQLEILHDPIITHLVEERIKVSHKNTEAVFQEVINEYNKVFEKIDDDDFEERISDIKDVSRRILRHLRPLKKETAACEKNSIVIAPDLIPSDALEAHFSEIKGFVAEKGGYTSHVGIIARAKGIPYVAKVNIDALMNLDIKNMIVDGISGEIIVNPSSETLKKYSILQEKYHKYFLEISSHVHLAAKTIDGEDVKIFSNIESLDDVPQVLQNKADGIGLYRSEYIVLTEKQFPSEERQFEIYKKILEKLEGRPAIVRLFDLGSDKMHFFLSEEVDIDHEMNPSLGCRGIRFLIKNNGIFEKQLRALLKASIYGNLRILIPMVSDISEFLLVKDKIKKTREDLEKEGKKVAKNIPLGCMIEVPSCAIMSHNFAKEADFFSIGSNDLTQYVIAADRSNPDTNYLYDFSHPSLFKLIEMTIKSAKKYKKEVIICGEMAADSKFTELLIGMGIRSFSISASNIATIKYAVRKTDAKDAIAMAKEALKINNVEDLKNFILKDQTVF